MSRLIKQLELVALDSGEIAKKLIKWENGNPACVLWETYSDVFMEQSRFCRRCPAKLEAGRSKCQLQRYIEGEINEGSFLLLVIEMIAYLKVRSDDKIS